MRIVKIVLWLFVFSANGLMAQFYSTGQDPASIKWLELRSPHFRFIFPECDSLLGYKTAKAFELAYNPVSRNMKVKPSKTPVLLHTHSIISNGLVVWAPRRSELYPNLSQDMIALDHIELLAIHEFRHIVQMNMLNNNFGKALYFLLGEQATGLITGLFIPPWFLEGDAVCSETAFSSSGRGRDPAFMNNYKALLLEKNKFSYDKAVFGSFKHFVPDHYELGYLITAQARKWHGVDLWPTVIKNVTKKPYTLTPFSNALKKNTGFRKAGLYKAVMDTLKHEWQSTNILSNYNIPVTLNSGEYARYSSLSPYKDSLHIALKSNLSETDRIITIDNTGKEKTLICPGQIIEASLNAAGEQIAYVKYNMDMRWQNRTYSDIYVYNITQKKAKRLTKKGRYHTAALNHDGTKIAAVYTTTGNKCGLHIIGNPSRDKLDEIPNDSNYYIISPVWNHEGNSIICVLHSDKGKALGLININSKHIEPITDFSQFEYTTPNFHNQYIVFNANFNGKLESFALDKLSKEIFRLTTSAYGAYDAIPDDNRGGIIYLVNTADGNNVVFSPYDSLLWQPLDSTVFVGNTLFQTLSAQENEMIDFHQNYADSFSVKRYSKAGHLFNFHSWAPFYIDIDRNAAAPGAVIFTQNLLSTCTGKAGYSYDAMENTGKYIAGIEYAGFYPVLSTQVEYGDRKLSISGSDNKISAKEKNILSGISLPFRFSKGHYYTQMQLFAHSNYMDITPLNDSIKSISAHASDYGFSFYNSTFSSHRDIYPRYAQTLQIRYAHSPLSKNNMGNLAGIYGSIYFPGILKNNSFYFTASFQKRYPAQYAFNFLYALPRGFYSTYENYNSIFKTTFNYALPVLYPDISIGPLFYIKRFKSELFFDYAQLYNKRSFLRSYGVDLTTDVHLLRFIAPVELGVRTIFRQNDGKWLFEPLFAVGFDRL